MDFGLFYYCQGRGVPHDQAYAEMLDQITLAEALGFGECWFAEHHFTDYWLLPSPNLMIAAALQRQSRARGLDFGIGKGVRPGEFTKLRKRPSRSSSRSGARTAPRTTDDSGGSPR